MDVKRIRVPLSPLTNEINNDSGSATAASYTEAIARVDKRLNATRLELQALVEDERNREALLLEHLERLEALRKETSDTRQRTREARADTASVLSELRAADELAMLSGMLAEKHTQLEQLQARHGALLQRLDAINKVFDSAAEPAPASVSVQDWTVAPLLRAADAMERLCERRAGHVGPLRHPLSFFHSSARKMSRTANAREEELAAQLEDTDALAGRAAELDLTLRAVEAEYQRSIRRAELSGGAVRHAIATAAAAEARALEAARHSAAERWRGLVAQMRERGLCVAEDLPPVSSAMADAVAEAMAAGAPAAAAAAAQCGMGNDALSGGSVALRSVAVRRHAAKEEGIPPATLSNETTRDMDNGTTRDMDNGTTRDMDNETTRDMDNGTTRDMDNETTRDMDNETTRDMDNETTRDMDNGTTRDMDNGTTRDMDNGTTRDMGNETTRDMDNGTTRDMDNETTRDMDNGTTRDMDNETTRGMDNETTRGMDNEATREVLELRRGVAEAAASVRALEEAYEREEDAAHAMLEQHEAETREMETRLRELEDAVAVLRAERMEWRSLQERMSTMVSL